MRQIFAAVFACQAILGVSACGEASPPPAEGKASVQSSTVSKVIGAGLSDGYEGTVLDGTNGVRVSCTVKKAGATFEVSGHIESSDVTLSISSSDISQGALMSFYIPSTGNPAETSVDPQNNEGPTCTLSFSAANRVAKSGSIFADYNCPKASSPSNLTTSHHYSGKFLFTGCSK